MDRHVGGRKISCAVVLALYALVILSGIAIAGMVVILCSKPVISVTEVMWISVVNAAVRAQYPHPILHRNGLMVDKVCILTVTNATPRGSR